jgi:hypothetical protein
VTPTEDTATVAIGASFRETHRAMPLRTRPAPAPSAARKSAWSIDQARTAAAKHFFAAAGAGGSKGGFVTLAECRKIFEVLLPPGGTLTAGGRELALMYRQMLKRFRADQIDPKAMPFVKQFLAEHTPVERPVDRTARVATTRALDPFEGVKSPALVRSLGRDGRSLPATVPAPVRRALLEAAAGLRAGAEQLPVRINGFYEIRRSATDKTVVAWAVQGSSRSGNRRDGAVLAFNPAGALVHEARAEAYG